MRLRRFVSSLAPLTSSALLALCVQLLSAPAWAAHTEDCPYEDIKVFRTALRYLRVNQGYKIVERDEATGYLLFEYPGKGEEKPTQGSMEVVGTDDGSKLIVRLADYPSYHEEFLAAGVVEKLRSDYGEPKRKPEEAPKEKPKDDEDDSEKGSEEEPEDDDGFDDSSF